MCLVLVLWAADAEEDVQIGDLSCLHLTHGRLVQYSSGMRRWPAALHSAGICVDPGGKLWHFNNCGAMSEELCTFIEFGSLLQNQPSEHICSPDILKRRDLVGTLDNLTYDNQVQGCWW